MRETIDGLKRLMTFLEKYDSRDSAEDLAGAIDSALADIEIIIDELEE